VWAVREREDGDYADAVGCGVAVSCLWGGEEEGDVVSEELKRGIDEWVVCHDLWLWLMEGVMIGGVDCFESWVMSRHSSFFFTNGQHTT
jgi:hypothetical protein